MVININKISKTKEELREIVEGSNLSSSVYYKIVAERNVSFLTVSKIARHLNVKMHEIVNGY